jgi:NSS family neurotransmitter:Na+ symporter
LFFLAAITSFIGAYEAIIAFLRDQHGIPRSKGVWMTGGGVLVLASLTAFSSRLFLVADYLANDIFLILGALVMSLFVGWVWGIPRFAEAAGIQSERTTALWAFLVKFLIPILIVVCWVAQLRGE